LRNFFAYSHRASSVRGDEPTCSRSPPANTYLVRGLELAVLHDGLDELIRWLLYHFARVAKVRVHEAPLTDLPRTKREEEDGTSTEYVLLVR
jgi:hypothetical protein